MFQPAKIKATLDSMAFFAFFCCVSLEYWDIWQEHLGKKNGEQIPSTDLVMFECSGDEAPDTEMAIANWNW